MENDFQDDNTPFDLKERIRVQLNSLSHQAYLLRVQLSEDICAQYGVQTSTFEHPTYMDNNKDIDFSVFDTHGVEKRIVVRLSQAKQEVPKPVLQKIKMLVRKLTNIYIQQTDLIRKLRNEIGFDIDEYKIDRGWTFKNISHLTH